MNITRKCRRCGAEYQYTNFANIITFCPECRKMDMLQCEYGYGPVVPCRICLGDKTIGVITYHDRRNSVFRIDADQYDIHRILSGKDMEALEEGCDIIAGLVLPETKSIGVPQKGGTAVYKKSGIHRYAGKENIFLACAFICAVAGVILPPSGSCALADEFCSVLMLIAIWSYIFVRLRQSSKNIRKNIKALIMIVYTAIVIWFSVMPTLDLVSGPVTAVLYSPQLERTQGHTGIFSRHYYISGEIEQGHKIRLEISDDEYSDFQSIDGFENGDLQTAVTVEYYEHTGRLVKLI